jgi:aspartyl-tRNA(Asn)/glutamyl-tRNA(Gln) amidotransferase subunit A
MMDLHELSIARAGKLLRSGELSSRALTLHALERIGKLNPIVHAFVLVTSDRAMHDAQRADEELSQGIDRGPMHGIPYALKDIIDTEGIRTTSHSKLFMDHVPGKDARVEAKLKTGGGVLVGKLATHEFALGGPDFNLPFPPARNPWNTNHFTGASSSGSAAAVASGMVRVALGSDTSGSIRGPACLCGTVGLKPTYGLVSKKGLFPLSWSLDHCGPLAASVEDAAFIMQVIAGYDPNDLGSANVPIPGFASQIGKDIEGLRIGYARHHFADDSVTSPEVMSIMDKSAEVLRSLGAIVQEVRLPDYELFNACGRIIMTAEGYAVHEHMLRKSALEYGRYTYQRLIGGAAIPAGDLVQAHRLRLKLAVEVNKILKQYHAILCACCLTPASPFSDFTPDWPPPKKATATQTIPYNVTGNPAIAVPAGFSADGLPLGIQLVGRAFDEITLLQIAAAFENAVKVRKTAPLLLTSEKPGV